MNQIVYITVGLGNRAKRIMGIEVIGKDNIATEYVATTRVDFQLNGQEKF